MTFTGSIMLRIYHNPRCSKSRAALARLQEAGLEPEIIRYLDTPPRREQHATIISKLDGPASELLRDTPDSTSMDDNTIIEAILATPKLLQRPVIEDETRAVIGRPTQRIDAFIAQ